MLMNEQKTRVEQVFFAHNLAVCGKPGQFDRQEWA